MPIPSFDELLSQARAIGEDRTQAAGYDRGGNMAKGIAGFVQNLLLTQNGTRAEYAGEVSPQGAVTPYPRPQVANRTVLEMLSGVPGVSTGAGNTPVTGAEAKTFALKRMEMGAKQPTSSEDQILNAQTLEKLTAAGFPVDANTTYKQAQMMVGQTLTDAQGKPAGETGLFRNIKILPKPPSEPKPPIEVPAEKAGLYTLSNESIRNIDSAMKVLFPKGTADSFNRSAATKSKLSFIGAAPFSKEGQNIRRWMMSALAGRQLIQTGVAARPDETKTLVDNFMAGAGSDPEAAMLGLQELQGFYKDYNEVLTTRKALPPREMSNLDALIGGTSVKKKTGGGVGLSVDDILREAGVNP